MIRFIAYSDQVISHTHMPVDIKKNHTYSDEIPEIPTFMGHP